ncbi:MAG: FIST signal transduction protein [Bradymonadaceae bacterium]
MDIASSYSTIGDPHQAVDAAYGRLVDQLGARLDFIVFAATVGYDITEIAARLKELAPGVPLHGSTSSQGVMTQEGYHSHEGYALGLWGLRDDGGAFGVGGAYLGDDPRRAGADAVLRALSLSGRPGELPQIIWLSSAPGNEEEVIAGIQDVIGPHVPILGGSSADDNVQGDWHQIANEDVFTDAAVVSVLYPSTQTMFGFHSGYEPTSTTGVATRVEGRTVMTIDGRPAVEVYDEWIGGRLPSKIREQGGSILADAPLWAPLGRPIRKGDSQVLLSYLLAHPDAVTVDGGIHFMAKIEEGECLVLMRGSKENLIDRPGRVVHSVMEIQGVRPEEIAGGLIIVCAGCMWAVDERSFEVVSPLNEALKMKSFLGTFTFGEQGCFFGGENRHGNLMISAVLFRQ